MKTIKLKITSNNPDFEKLVDLSTLVDKKYSITKLESELKTLTTTDTVSYDDLFKWVQKLPNHTTPLQVYASTLVYELRNNAEQLEVEEYENLTVRVNNYFTSYDFNDDIESSNRVEEAIEDAYNSYEFRHLDKLLIATLFNKGLNSYLAHK
jgi:hypothetical protein